MTVAVPLEREVQDYDEYTGKMVAADSVDIRARVQGYLEEIGFKDGVEVKKGQLLFQIDPRPFEEQLKASEAQRDQYKARRIKAAADVARYKDLVPKGAATAQDLDKAIGDLGEAEANIRSAEASIGQAKLQLEYARLTAPYDGLSSKASVGVGNLIGASGGEQLLTTIVKIDPIRVEFDVDQRAIQRIRKQYIAEHAGEPIPKTIREMNIPFYFGLASEEGFPHTGVLDFVDNQVDPTTGTILVRGEVDNKQRLFKPGFFARIRLTLAAPYRAMLVPDRAIGTQQGQKYVLVVDDTNKVVFRPVTLGALQKDGLRVVQSGLKAGERVVINGIQRARPGSVVNPQGGSMIPEASTKSAETRPAETKPTRSEF